MHPAERVLTLLTGAEAVLDSTPPAEWNTLKAFLSRASDTMEAADPRAETVARDALLTALRSLSTITPTNRVYDLRLAETLLGASLGIQNWDSGMTRLLSTENAAEANVNLQAGIAPIAPAVTCTIAFAELPGWTITCLEETRLAPEKTTEVKVFMRSPTGAKGFFRLPATVTYTGEGWTLKCRANLTTLTENRICQWVAAGPFTDTAKALANQSNWRALTNANVHGAMDMFAFAGPHVTGQTSVAVSILHVTRPTPVRFNLSGPIRLYLDGNRLGTDIQRGTWGATALTPGEHILKAVMTPEKKGAGSFKVSCDVADTCFPGDLLILPAAEVLKRDLTSAAKQ
jgi:hypothetical protein